MCVLLIVFSSISCMKATPLRYHAQTHIRYPSKCNVTFVSSFSLSNMATAAEEGYQFRGLISQQEKFSKVKIESYKGLLK